MKSLFQVTLFLLFLTGGINDLMAQKVKYDYDDGTEVMSVNGSAYAKIVKSNFNAIGLIKNFSIRNLKDEELIFMQYSLREEWSVSQKKYINKVWYEITFIESGARAAIKKQFAPRGIMKLVYENNLIKDGKIDKEAEIRFIRIKKGRQGKHTAKPKPVTPVLITGNEIFKNETKRGKFIQKSETSETGVKMNVISVYSKTNEKIAIAKVASENPDEWSVFTTKDEKTSDILYESENPKESLFNWLISKYYL